MVVKIKKGDCVVVFVGKFKGYWGDVFKVFLRINCVLV